MTLTRHIRPFVHTRGKLSDWIVHGGRQSLLDVGDQALIRGLDTAFPGFRPGLSLSIARASVKTGHKTFAGSSPAAALPPVMHEIILTISVLRCYARWLDFAGDGPDESRHFASDCSHRDGWLFPLDNQSAIARTKPDLSLPGNVDHRLR
jgi:hypothetical protein